MSKKESANQSQWNVVNPYSEQPFELLENVAENAVELFDVCNLSEDEREEAYLITLTYLARLIDLEEMENGLVEFIPQLTNVLPDFHNRLRPAFLKKKPNQA